MRPVDFPPANAKAPIPPEDNQIDLSAREGLTLIAAFRKIRDVADRRAVIYLTERLGN